MKQHYGRPKVLLGQQRYPQSNTSPFLHPRPFLSKGKFRAKGKGQEGLRQIRENWDRQKPLAGKQMQTREMFFIKEQSYDLDVSRVPALEGHIGTPTSMWAQGPRPRIIAGLHPHPHPHSLGFFLCETQAWLPSRGCRETFRRWQMEACTKRCHHQRPLWRAPRDPRQAICPGPGGPG